MTPETALILKVQTPSMLKALRMSYGIATSKSTAKRAQALAPTVKAFRPGVYHVGACIVDLWRMACSCEQSRTRKAKGIQPGDRPCPHFVALYLVGDWNPTDSDPCLYLKSVKIEQPAILALYASVPDPRTPYAPGKRTTARIEKGSKGFIAINPANEQEFWAIEAHELKNFTPFYK